MAMMRGKFHRVPVGVLFDIIEPTVDGDSRVFGKQVDLPYEALRGLDCDETFRTQTGFTIESVCA